jgi:transcriptional antiterminator
MKKIKYSKEAVNLIAERMTDEFLKQFVLLWLGTNATLEQLAEQLNYSTRQIERYAKKVKDLISQMPDIVNGEVKYMGSVSMVGGHIDEPKKFDIEKYVKERDEMLLKGSVNELKKFIAEHETYYDLMLVDIIARAKNDTLEKILHTMIINCTNLPEDYRQKSLEWLQKRSDTE